MTREQMAAFMHRLAVGRSVDAATVEGMTASDLVGQTGPVGPTGPSGSIGPVGPIGPEGPPGISDIYVVSEFFTLNPNQSFHVAIGCDVGDLVTGGGYFLNDRAEGFTLSDAQRNVEVFANGPMLEFGALGLGWEIGIRNMSDSTQRTGNRIAVCADITP